MNNKFYIVYVDGESTPTLKHTDKESAEKEAQILADKFGKKAFVLETDSIATPNEINVKIDSYEAAIESFGKSLVPVTCSDFNRIGVSDKHIRAITAIYQLIIIAEAWNKADEFVPDFSNADQYKWFPWFEKEGNKYFSYSFVDNTVSYTGTNLGVRLCFKTAKRATQFGKQFIDLWNDLLL